MKTINKILTVIYILSLRFGFQRPLFMSYPDNVEKTKKKYKNYKLTEDGQRKQNWR